MEGVEAWEHPIGSGSGEGRGQELAHLLEVLHDVAIGVDVARQTWLFPSALWTNHIADSADPPPFREPGYNGAMRFHMHLLPTYFPGTNAPFEVYYREVLDELQLAEELGWECFWFTEHHFLHYGGAMPNPALILAAAAARTSKIHLGSAISILPLHHPLQVAEDYAMVDAVSDGRLEFGIGLGNTALDFQAFGVDRETSRQRFDEAADIIRRAWSEERFSHHGAFWQFDDVALLPRPAQQPTPPFWVAGISADSLGWAGRHGCHIMTVAHAAPPEAYVPGMNAWRSGLIDEGYDPSSYHCKLHLRVWVDEDGERARAVAEPAITNYEQVASIGRERKNTVPPDQYDWKGMLARGRNAYGNPDQVVEAIRLTMANYEFDILSTTFNFGGIPHEAVAKAMRLFAREVMPAFA